ncbi:DNA repair exonuclease [Piedraia hortae CBS 480.64]|uniref:Double-strand break repair protein n=1 Tax=Piedraia hortae CBS 480.64 TaxID=1314780 RepID=A0A6A7C207_9PEZI|nr:DNA repair exonuclease [Piedraia hortae CBS 480.64]
MSSTDFTDADTIKILVSTDNHVGYNERDPIRGDDSWRSFHEIMCLATERDVDMVLLAGDLFHENKPSRKSMYQVMRSLRMNCYGDKPCELEMLSDGSEQFLGTFNHVNYEDPNINVSIPVFSIHGNHDDPSGEGHLAALDILDMSGLLNYYGRTPESDNIVVKPVLLQKGKTKLALYGMSNVRDERLYRTFRERNVKFFRPTAQKDDWFNILSVHQNHHAYTETGYLPETLLPRFMDLVIWGHEHECLIDPVFNSEMGFHVIQPGSSVATSLVQGETVTKYVSLVKVQGKAFEAAKIRLKTVRPFVMKEIVLRDIPDMNKVAYEDDNRPKITRFLMAIVEELIEKANEQWREARVEAGEDENDDARPPAPIIRLRVEYTPPEGGNFDPENPQRFSNRFIGRVANVHDVVQFHRKRQAQRGINGKPDLVEDGVMAQLQTGTVKIEKLVSEFLKAQSLSILPQNKFSDAVSQFVDKDDNRAMSEFVESSLETQVKQLIGEDDDEDSEVDGDTMADLMGEIKAKLEAQFAKGERRQARRQGMRKPKPDYWDSEVDGHWEDDPGSYFRNEAGEVVHQDDGSVDATPAGPAPKSRPARAPRGKAAGRGSASTRAKTTTSRRPQKQKTPVREEEDEEDVVMIDDDDDDVDEEDSPLFVQPARKQRGRATTRTTQSRRGGMQQSTLSFAASQSSTTSRRGGRTAASRRLQEPSDDEISDDDAFEPAPPTTRSRATRR